MKKEKYINQLVDVGLSPREAKIYLGLLTKNSFTATEVAKISGIPRQTIYELLDNLIKKGMCVEKAGKVKKYKAVSPESVFKGLIEQYKEKEKAADKLSSSLLDIYKENMQKVEALEYIEVLKDKGQINRRWLSLQKNAKKSILAFTKPPYSAPLSENLDKEIDALKRTVKIRSIYEYKNVINEDLISLISSWIREGEEARVIEEELPIKLVIFDEKITMCALNDPVSLKPSITTMIVNHESYARAQKHMFESYWEKSIPFEEFKIK